MQPHGAQWNPNPQPLRTKVMGDAAGCGRTDAIGEACAPIEKHDASTPQARTSDNLLNMDKTPLLAACLGTLGRAAGNGSTRRRVLSRSQAVSPRFSLWMANFGFNPEHARLDTRNPSPLAGEGGSPRAASRVRGLFSDAANAADPSPRAKCARALPQGESGEIEASLRLESFRQQGRHCRALPGNPPHPTASACACRRPLPAGER